METRNLFKRAVIPWAFLVAAVLAGDSINATPDESTGDDRHYFSGTVTLDDEPFTGSAYVSLSCRDSSSSYYYYGSTCSDWANVSGDGEFEFSRGSDYAYRCCSKGHEEDTWEFCELNAYQWSDQDVAGSDYYEVELDCSELTVQKLPLRRKSATAKIKLEAGGQPIASGMTVSCYQKEKPWTSGYANEATYGAWEVPLTKGTFSCSAYCDWQTYQYDCPYIYDYNNELTITITEDDQVVEKTLTLDVKDKVIRFFSYLNEELISSDDVSVWCSSQSSPWYSSSGVKNLDEGSLDVKVAAGDLYCSCYSSRYAGYPHEYIAVDNEDGVVEAECNFIKKDRPIRIHAFAGMQEIKTGLSVYCNQQGGNWVYDSSSTPDSNNVYQLMVATGTYQCSASFNDWQNPVGAGYPRATVVIDQGDVAGADVTLQFLENNATLSGIVTDGESGIGDIWIGINAYQVQSASSDESAVSAMVMQGLEVHSEAAVQTQVYVSTQTDSNGAFQRRLPAGSYQACAWAPWDRKDLMSTCQEITVAANQTTLIRLGMTKKSGLLKGRVSDAEGQGVRAYLNCYANRNSTTQGDYIWTETGEDGTYEVNLAEDFTYNCQASLYWGYSYDNKDRKLCSYTKEGMQVVTASEEPKTLNFTVPTCDCEMTLNATDDNGDIVPSIRASCNASPAERDLMYYYYGLWTELRGGTGRMMVEKDVTYDFDCWFWDQQYNGASEPERAICSGDEGGTVEIPVEAVIEDAVCGSYVDSTGSSVELESHYVYVSATKGRRYRSCQANRDGFCCDLSAGDWVLNYWIDPYSDYTSASATENKVSIPESGGVRQDLILFGTGTIEVTVLEMDGSARNNVSVSCCPYPAAAEGYEAYHYGYNCGWCYSSGADTCSMRVAADTDEEIEYFCNAFVSYYDRTNEHLNTPKEQAVQLKQGETKEVTLQFGEPDGFSRITVVLGQEATDEDSLGKAMKLLTPAPLLKTVVNADDETAASPIAFATVDCFSPNGGSFEVTTDASGEATCPCTIDDPWFAVAHKMVGNAVYKSEVEQISCALEGGGGTLVLDHVSNAPEGKCQTIADVATESLTLELSDDSSFYFPPGSLGAEEAKASCCIDIIITPHTPSEIPLTNTAFALSCHDADGKEITKLNNEAELCLAYKESDVEASDVPEENTKVAYWDNAKGCYTEINKAVRDIDGNTICFTQDHLTDFALIGKGNLGAVQGEDNGPLNIAEAEPIDLPEEEYAELTRENDSDGDGDSDAAPFSGPIVGEPVEGDDGGGTGVGDDGGGGVGGTEVAGALGAAGCGLVPTTHSESRFYRYDGSRFRGARSYLLRYLVLTPWPYPGGRP